MILGTLGSAVDRQSIKHVGKGGEHLMGKEEREENPMACLCVCHSSPSHQDQEVTFLVRKNLSQDKLKRCLHNLKQHLHS